MAFEPNNLRPIARNSQTGSTIWFYQSTVDDIATMLLDDHFEAELTSLAVGDVIVMEGTDHVSMQSVESVGAAAPNGVILKTFRGIDASSVDVTVDSSLDAGGTPPQPFVQNVLSYLVGRMNLKVQDGTNIGTGKGILKEIDRDTEPTGAIMKLRSISSSTLTIVEGANEITINT